MHLYNIEWRYIVDWVVIASCFVTVLTIVIDLIKSAKSNKNLSKEHERLEEEHKDIRLKYCGSTNQRVIDVKQSIEQNKIVLYK